MVYLTDLQDSDLVRIFFDRLDKVSRELLVVLNSEPNLAAAHVGDVDVAGGSGGVAAGLKQTRHERGAVGELVELLRAVVIGQHVERKHVPDRVQAQAFGEETGHCGVVDGEDGDGQPAVDFAGEVG